MKQLNYLAPKVPTANIKLKIYYLEFSNNEKYVGYTTTSLNKRLSNHKRVHNDVISINELEEFELSNQNQKDKIILESYWIEQFRQWGFLLRNKNKGGGGSLSGTITEDTRKKQSEKKLNIPLTEQHKEKISLSHITRDKKTYVSGMKNKNHSILSKKLISDKLKDEKHYNYGNSANNCVQVIQFSKNNQKLKEWSSITKASISLNLCRTDIIKVLKGKRKTCGGYIWKYKN
jgi:hypothetical protein